MTRRNFLRQSIGGGALLTLATPAIAQEATTLTLLSVDMESATALKTRIETATDGQMVINVQEVADSDRAGVLDRIAGGEADLGLSPLRYFSEQNLALAMFDSMPYGLSSGEISGWVSASDGRSMLQSLLGDYGVTAQFIADTGTPHLWSRAPIADSPSATGLRIGSRGLGLLSWQAMGATNLSDLDDASVSWGDLDVIDGINVVEMQAKGLVKTFPNVAQVNPNTPTALSALIMNDASNAALPESARMVLERACSAELARCRSMAFHDNATAFVAQSDVISTFELPNDLWANLNLGAKSVLETLFQDGRAQSSVVDAYVYFMSDIARWSEIGEAAYYAGRKRLTAL